MLSAPPEINFRQNLSERKKNGYNGIYLSRARRAFRGGTEKIYQRLVSKISLQMKKSCHNDSFFPCFLLARNCISSTSAGTMNNPQVVPRIAPVANLEECVLSQISKNPSDQSTPIGIIARKSQKRENGSVSSMRRTSGQIRNPTSNPK